jgi:hypothetical protein
MKKAKGVAKYEISKKIINVSPKANSELILVLRYESCNFFIELHQSKKVFYSIDESWPGQSNFHRRSYQQSDSGDSESVNSIRPRVSMISCIYNFGEIYLSLSIANTSEDIMMIFISGLI